MNTKSDTVYPEQAVCKIRAKYESKPENAAYIAGTRKGELL